jgi:hypothetical protein
VTTAVVSAVEPLKITFFLRTPISLAFPWMNFDSLVLHAVLRERLGERYYSLPSKIPSHVAEEALQDVPLKKWRDLFVASVSLIDGEPSVFHYYKRGDFPFPKGKISRGSGFFKDFMLKAVYVPAKSVTFYATGEAEELRRLLRLIPALGKETNIGFGWVKSFAVEEAEGEYGLVKDGRAMRPIPVEYVRYYEDAAPLAYRPPYWARENVRMCVVPFTRVEL